MSSALDDPRADDLVHLRLSELHGLATQFSHVSSQAGDAISGLHGAHGDAAWTGDAADRFRTGLGKLPGDLQTVQQSYADTASALSTYADQVEPLRTRWLAIAPELQGAQQKLTTAQGDHTTAKSTVTSLSGDVDGINAPALRILDEFDGVRRTAVSVIKHAGDRAPQHHSSFWGSVGHAFSNVVKGAGNAVVSLAKDTWKAAKSLPDDVHRVWDHPFSLKDWTKLGSDLGTVAGAVAIVASIVICPADALGFAGAADALEVVGDGAEAFVTYESAEKTGADTYEAATGKGSWSTVVDDEVATVSGKALDGALGKATGEDAADELRTGLKTKSEGISAYRSAVADGKTSKQAYGSLTDEQKEMLRGSARQLRSPTRINRLTTVTQSQLNGATTRARYIHGAKTAVVDPIADHGKEAVLNRIGLGEDDGDKGDNG